MDGLRSEYGRIGLTVAQRIVESPQIAKECVQDGMMAMWNAQ